MSVDMSKTLVVVSAGIGEESATARLADGLTKAVRQAAAGVEVDVVRIDLRDLSHEIASASLTGFAAGPLAAAYEALGRADAVIAVSPTYKASYTGLFKGFWDVTPDGVMSGVPVVVGASGGTARHSLVTDFAMRPLFAYMRALVLPTAIFAAPEDWAGSSLSARMSAAATEVVTQWGLAQATSRHPEASTPSEDDGKPADDVLAARRDRARDPFVNVPTMDQMLRS